MLGHGLNISKHQPSGTAPLLLDAFPGAAAAYSLRELSKDWEGQAVVRVRRDFDNAEVDFTMAEILDGDLLAWVYGASSVSAFNTLPADHGTGAEAAYSLRYVNATYEAAGSPVVRVRRSSDNAEADFTPTEITDGTLTTWTGANDGLVVTWYDQSNSNDATQVIGTGQPRIVASGVVETLVGIPTVDFNGSTQWLTSTSYTMASAFAIAKNEAITNPAQYLLGGSGTGLATGGTSPSVLGIFMWDNGSGLISTINNIARHVISALYDSSPDSLYVEGVLEQTGTIDPVDVSTIGTRADLTTLAFNGKAQELIIYSDDQTSTRLDVEANINNYYSVYPVNGYVTKWYDQSGNIRDIIQATAGSQPILINSGTLITLNSLPALEFATDRNLYKTGETMLYSTDFSVFAVTRSTVSLGDPVNAVLVTAGKNLPGEGRFLFENSLGGDMGIGYSGFNSGTSLPSVTDGNQEIKTWIATNQITSATATTVGTINSTLSSSYNSTSVITPTGTETFYIGYQGYTSSQGYNDKVQELIFYHNNQSANRTGIEANINDYYTLF